MALFGKFSEGSEIIKFPKIPRSSIITSELKTLRVWSLKKFKKFLEWIIRLKDENDRINRSILKDLGLPENTAISTLGSYHKREFRRLKYIFHSRNSPVKIYKEPDNIVFSTDSSSAFSNKSQKSIEELFKSMKNRSNV